LSSGRNACWKTPALPFRSAVVGTMAERSGALAPGFAVPSGRGNGTGDGTEGAYNDTVFGTYMHGPVLARNPQIADLLLKLALDVNALPPTDDRWYEALRAERIASAQQPA